MDNKERYANIVYGNLEKFPTIKKNLEKSIDKWINKGLPYYLEQALIRSIYYNERQNSIASKFEEFLKFIIEKKRSKNIQSKISRLNEKPEANFDEFYSELRAGHYLWTKCKAKGIEFSTKGKSYDILYFVESDNNEYYVEVKSLRSLDPYRDIFLNKISTKAIFDPRYNSSYYISYDYPEGERIGIIHEESKREVLKVIEDLDYEFRKGKSFTLPTINNGGHRKYKYLNLLEANPTTSHRPVIIVSGKIRDDATIKNLISRVIGHCREAYSQIKEVRKGDIEYNDMIVIFLNWDDYEFYGDNFSEELNNQIKLWRSELSKNIQVKLL